MTSNYLLFSSNEFNPRSKEWNADKVWRYFYQDDHFESLRLWRSTHHNGDQRCDRCVIGNLTCDNINGPCSACQANGSACTFSFDKGVSADAGNTPSHGAQASNTAPETAPASGLATSPPGLTMPPSGPTMPPAGPFSQGGQAPAAPSLAQPGSGPPPASAGRSALSPDRRDTEGFHWSTAHQPATVDNNGQEVTACNACRQYRPGLACDADTRVPPGIGCTVCKKLDIPCRWVNTTLAPRPDGMTEPLCCDHCILNEGILSCSWRNKEQGQVFTACTNCIRAGKACVYLGVAANVISGSNKTHFDMTQHLSYPANRSQLTREAQANPTRQFVAGRERSRSPSRSPRARKEPPKGKSAKRKNTRTAKSSKQPSAIPPGGNTSAAPGGNTSTAPGGGAAIAPGGNTAIAPGGSAAMAPGGSAGGSAAMAPGGNTATGSGPSRRGRPRRPICELCQKRPNQATKCDCNINLPRGCKWCTNWGLFCVVNGQALPPFPPDDPNKDRIMRPHFPHCLNCSTHHLNCDRKRPCDSCVARGINCDSGGEMKGCFHRGVPGDNHPLYYRRLGYGNAGVDDWLPYTKRPAIPDNYHSYYVASAPLGGLPPPDYPIPVYVPPNVPAPGDDGQAGLTGGVPPNQTGGVPPNQTGGVPPKQTGGVPPKQTGGVPPNQPNVVPPSSSQPPAPGQASQYPPLSGSTPEPEPSAPEYYYPDPPPQLPDSPDQSPQNPGQGTGAGNAPAQPGWVHPDLEDGKIWAHHAQNRHRILDAMTDSDEYIRNQNISDDQISNTSLGLLDSEEDRAKFGEAVVFRYENVFAAAQFLVKEYHQLLDLWLIRRRLRTELYAGIPPDQSIILLSIQEFLEVRNIASRTPAIKEFSVDIDLETLTPEIHQVFTQLSPGNPPILNYAELSIFRPPSPGPAYPTFVPLAGAPEVSDNSALFPSGHKAIVDMTRLVRPIPDHPNPLPTPTMANIALHRWLPGGKLNRTAQCTALVTQQIGNNVHNIRCTNMTSSVCEDSQHSVGIFICDDCEAKSRGRFLKVVAELALRMRAYACTDCVRKGTDQHRTWNNSTYRVWGLKSDANNRAQAPLQRAGWNIVGGYQPNLLPVSGCACVAKLLDHRICTPHRLQYVARVNRTIGQMDNYVMSVYGRPDPCPFCRVNASIQAFDFHGDYGGAEQRKLWACKVCHDIVVANPNATGEIPGAEHLGSLDPALYVGEYLPPHWQAFGASLQNNASGPSNDAPPAQGPAPQSGA